MEPFSPSVRDPPTVLFIACLEQITFMHEVFMKVSSMHPGASVQSLPVWVNVANWYTGAHATTSQLHKYSKCLFLFLLSTLILTATPSRSSCWQHVAYFNSQQVIKSFLPPGATLGESFPAHNGRSQSTQQSAGGCSKPGSRKAPAHQRPSPQQ